MKVWLKRIGYTMGVIVGLLLVAVGAVYATSEVRFRRTYAVPREQISVANDSATLARGEHIATVLAGCTDCHGDGFRGNVMFDAAPMGRLVALNLTTGDGGVGGILTPELIERAVRHGVSPDGHPLRIMPTDDFQYMTDDDLRAVVSYLQHVAPANNVLAPSSLMLLPRALMVFGALPLLPAEKLQDSAARPMTISPAPTKEYGGYLAILAGCRNCHGPGLSGGKIVAGDPSWGPAANLTRAGNLGKWTEAEFVKTIRTGLRPDGSPLKDPMPWKVIGRMTDDELHAIWLYLESVPAKAYGNH